MEKINFVNNSEPYLSAENLNQMQSNIEDAIEEKQTYSTEEQVIGTYNGKPLYRKTITGTTGSTKEVWNTVSTITDIDSWHIPKLSFVLYKNDNEHYVNLFKSIDFMVNSSSQLQVKHYSDYYGNCGIEIVIEYTKTTD